MLKLHLIVCCNRLDVFPFRREQLKKTVLKQNLDDLDREIEAVNRTIRQAETELSFLKREYVERRQELEQKLNEGRVFISYKYAKLYMCF